MTLKDSKPFPLAALTMFYLVKGLCQKRNVGLVKTKNKCGYITLFSEDLIEIGYHVIFILLLTKRTLFYSSCRIKIYKDFIFLLNLSIIYMAPVLSSSFHLSSKTTSLVRERGDYLHGRGRTSLSFSPQIFCGANLNPYVCIQALEQKQDVDAEYGENMQELLYNPRSCLVNQNMLE
ncbi:hypothetical protein ABKV19_007796 [Rosa sericea]